MMRYTKIKETGWASIGRIRIGIDSGHISARTPLLMIIGDGMLRFGGNTFSLGDIPHYILIKQREEPAGYDSGFYRLPSVYRILMKTREGSVHLPFPVLAPGRITGAPDDGVAVTAVSIFSGEIDRFLENYGGPIGVELDMTLFDNLSKAITVYFDKIIDVYRDRIVYIEFSGLFDNLLSFRDIFDVIYFIEKNIHADVLKAVSGKIPPDLIPLIVYYGFDIISADYTINAGLGDLYFLGNGFEWIRKMESDLPCTCQYCLGLGDISEGKTETGLLRIYTALHNFSSAVSIMNKTIRAIKNGNLRTLTENYTAGRPPAEAMLIYSDHYTDPATGRNPIVDRYSLYMESKLICSGPLSYYDPRIVKFRLRVACRCRPFIDTRAAVFLPCSMVKPYSKSKSHKRFDRIIKKNISKKYRDKVARVVVTSPLGIVPSELEEVYPAAHYDLPVTGNWDNEEILITAGCISDWLEKLSDIAGKRNAEITGMHLKEAITFCGTEERIGLFPKSVRNRSPLFGIAADCITGMLENMEVKVYTGDNAVPVIAFLEGGYLESFINALYILLGKKATLPGPIFITSDGDSFGKILEDINDRINKVTLLAETGNERADLTSEEKRLSMIADFQFGKGAGADLIGDAARFVQMRNENYRRILGFEPYGTVELGRYYRKTGMITPTYEGGLRLIRPGNIRNKLILNTHNPGGSTVFRPAVARLDPELCAGDIVFICNPDGDLLAVGTMIVGAETALRSRSGAIAKIRKRKPTDPPPEDFINRYDFI